MSGVKPSLEGRGVKVHQVWTGNPSYPQVPPDRLRENKICPRDKVFKIKIVRESAKSNFCLLATKLRFYQPRLPPLNNVINNVEQVVFDVVNLTFVWNICILTWE